MRERERERDRERERERESECLCLCAHVCTQRDAAKVPVGPAGSFVALPVHC